MKKILSILILLSVLSTDYATNVRWALQNVPDMCLEFHDGLAVFRGDNGLYGTIDTQGRVAIPTQYKSIKPFSGGMAIVETKAGIGIINKRNQFVLPPQANCIIENPRGDDSKSHKDIYILVHQDNQHKDIWYKNRFVLKDIDAQYISIIYPFVHWNDRESDMYYAINVNTGDIIQANYISIRNHGDFIEILLKAEKGSLSSYYFYDPVTGESIKNYNISTKGYVVSSKNYCNQLMAPDSTLIYEGTCHYPIWQNGIVVFTNRQKYQGDGTFSKRDTLSFFAADGKLISRTTTKSGEYVLATPYKKGVVMSIDMQKGYNNYQYVLYDYKGNELLSGSDIYNINLNWFRIISNDKKSSFLYNIETRKKVEIEAHYSFSVYNQDDVMIAKNKKGRYILCGLIGNYAYPLDANINFIWDFSEGVAIVDFKDGTHGLIDRLGNIILRDDENFFLHLSSCSEGVISAYNKKTNNNGFIYSPLASGKYVYDKNANNDNLMDEGLALFEKGQYTRAKDCFYEIMINDPTNVSAIINYAASLNNMGYYDSAIDAYITVLQIDPDNALAKESLQTSKSNKAAAQQNAAMQQQRANTWFDGITTFLNILGQSFGQYSAFSSDLNTSRSTVGNFDGYSSGSTCKGCNGTGHCSMCKGKGWYKNSHDGKIYDCPSCHSSGRCGVCYGKGVIR